MTSPDMLSSVISKENTLKLMKNLFMTPFLFVLRRKETLMTRKKD